MIKKSLIVLDTDKTNYKSLRRGTEHNNYANTYSDIIETLITGYTLGVKYPEKYTCCKIDTELIGGNSDILKMLSSIYNYVVPTKNNETGDKKIKKIKKKYDYIKKYKSDDIKNNNDFDNDYEYNIVKKILGPNTVKHFMFKERDIEIQQRGGFDFNKKKIKFPKKNDDPALRTICQLYHVDSNMIRHYHMKYYFLLKSSQFRPYRISPLFDEINEYEYIQPIKKISLYHSDNNYYHELFTKNETHLKKIGKQRLDEANDLLEEDRDTIMLQYLKCRQNIFIITIWNTSLLKADYLENLLTFLANNGNIYYVKKIKLSKYGLKNLMFMVNDGIKYEGRNEIITQKMKGLNISDNNETCFIFFDNVQKKYMSNAESKFQNEIRDELGKYIISKDVNLFDLLYTNEYFYQMIEFAQSILNKNTLDMIEYQDCDMFSETGNNISNLQFQTLRKILYSDFSLLEIDRTIITSNCLYAYGIRSYNYIDTFVIDIEPKTSHKLFKYIENFFINTKSKFYFLNSDTKEDAINKYEKLLNILKIKDPKELVLNPKNYFYYQGIKIVSIDFTIIQKIIRFEIHDIIDLVILCIIYPELSERYFSLSKDKKSKKIFDINSKYTSIAAKNNDFDVKSFSTIERNKVLHELYTNEQIHEIKDNELFKYFFE